MRCTVLAIGRASAGPARDLFDLYAGRLSPPLTLIELEEKRKLPDAQRSDREAELLVQALPRDAILVSLDERGAVLSSEQFADRLRQWRDSGVGDLVFAIGGAAGHGAAIRNRANFTLSLGPMTWPHMLVRGLIAEQLYRGHSILTGHPYHRA
jgi:23S rRNA (pseudouridine1915-N3)-methyltransferase